MEGSKDGDFLADLEGPPDDDPLLRVASATASDDEGLPVGSKRIKQDPSDQDENEAGGFQEEEVGGTLQCFRVSLTFGCESHLW